MENRREPLTTRMVKSKCRMVERSYLAAKTSRAKRNIFLSDDATMRDWFALGLQTGFRLSEWAQANQKETHMERVPDGRIRAMGIADIRFYGPNRRRLHYNDRTILQSVASADITWKVQKNQDNGQSITHHADPDQDMCPVAACLNIRRRWQLLGGTRTMPLAICRSQNGKRTLAAANVINKHLQALAKDVYGITDRVELSRFTSHSLRVGAAVQLHVAGKSIPFIKKALRWKSDTFERYFRNVGALADQRNDAINAHDPDGAGTNEVAHVAACAIL